MVSKASIFPAPAFQTAAQAAMPRLAALPSRRPSNPLLKPTSFTTSLHPLRRSTPHHPAPPPQPRAPHRPYSKMRISGSDTEKLLTNAKNRGVARPIAERIVLSAERCAREWSAAASDFLTPPESAAMLATLATVPDLQVARWGGYSDAERAVVLAAHADLADSPQALVDLRREDLVLLRIDGAFDAAKGRYDLRFWRVARSEVTHRDFMGAILNAGVSRSKVGDIIVLESRGAQVVVSAEIAEFMQGAVTAVRNVEVQVSRRPLEEVEVPVKRVKELQSVEASMRLDAVVSAGLNVSRSKLAAMARSGLVSLNYKEAKGPAKNVKSGDVISVRGVGKLEIGECSSTAKGKHRIQMKRYM